MNSTPRVIYIIRTNISPVHFTEIENNIQIYHTNRDLPYQLIIFLRNLRDFRFKYLSRICVMYLTVINTFYYLNRNISYV